MKYKHQTLSLSKVLETEICTPKSLVFYHRCQEENIWNCVKRIFVVSQLAKMWQYIELLGTIIPVISFVYTISISCQFLFLYALKDSVQQR